ncbi:MAG: guanylate kinase [Chloroflexi bacterium]|nr:guanylate kinase [Chloroflexota bacterium]
MDFDDFRSEDPPALLLVVSGSSGVGKDAIIDRMKELRCPFFYVVTATTRAQRANETDGVHYHFVTVESFEQMIEKGELLEWAKVYENFYGVPRRSVSEAMKNGRDVVVKVDVQGAATIRRAVPGAVLVFIRPPSMEELENRLRSRRSETASELAVRLGKAAGEYKQLPLFDYVLTSQQGRIDEVVRQIQAIVVAEKCRVNPRRVEL